MWKQIEIVLINENADPDVQADLSDILDRLVRERAPYYRHVMEGDDDMPAHAKASLIGPSLTIPISDGRLNLGTWQGIYLCEFRNNGGARKVVVPSPVNKGRQLPDKKIWNLTFTFYNKAVLTSVRT